MVVIPAIPRAPAAWVNAGALAAVVVAAALVIAKNLDAAGDRGAFLNVSYDPTRELYRDVDTAFTAAYRRQVGETVSVRQSHGGSTRQAHAVIDGAVSADVVTLALPSDVDLLQKNGLVAPGWRERLPNRSSPYTSTIVFVVRRGNPRGIRDFVDLARDDGAVVTPNPKTSGNGKLSFLAAWGSVLRRGGTEEDARALVTAIYGRVASLEPAARDATIDFVDQKIGDVQMTWESEAQREVDDARGELEIVYPPASILAEPAVAWVDANVKRKGTEALAKAYLGFLFAEEGQDIIARDGYRPTLPDVLARYREKFPPIDLFPITLLAGDWNEANLKFFADDAIFDAIVPPRRRG